MIKKEIKTEFILPLEYVNRVRVYCAEKEATRITLVVSNGVTVNNENVIRTVQTTLNKKEAIQLVNFLNEGISRLIDED